MFNIIVLLFTWPGSLLFYYLFRKSNGISDKILYGAIMVTWFIAGCFQIPHVISYVF